MKTYTEKDVEDFLIDRYGTKILVYKGFYALRYIICHHNDIVDNLANVYNEYANENKTTISAIERAIRHFRTRINTNTESNKELINLLIIEFQRWL